MTWIIEGPTLTLSQITNCVHSSGEGPAGAFLFDSPSAMGWTKQQVSKEPIAAMAMAIAALSLIWQIYTFAVSRQSPNLVHQWSWSSEAVPYRDNLFESEGSRWSRWCTVAIENRGSSPGVGIDGTIVIPEDVNCFQVSGWQDVQILDSDGTWVPVGIEPIRINPKIRLIRFRVQKIVPGLRAALSICLLGKGPPLLTVPQLVLYADSGPIPQAVLPIR